MASQPNSPNAATADPASPESLPSPPPGVMMIAQAPEDIVRAVLIALCKDRSQELKVMEYFVKLDKLKSKRESINAGAISTGAETDVANPVGTNANNPKKRRAISEIAICEYCRAPFSEDDNPPDACEYHPGNLDVNDEASIWQDWDDWPDHNEYSEESKEQYPEGTSTVLP
ncbi:hypothetical protein E0Z10_g438 [Xylaria hypoxylon]|uniref:Uncharacterized protein n=1 Tax=Xylaria hypoxylon TaxID=37992 RepID=A0A4Z0YW23_9PEZI|nr:hypothetical protein E0Z10_g438 [Xylaria hypoxylon]